MTTLYVLVDEATGKKFLMWKIRDEAEDLIGDGTQELPKGEPFLTIPWAELMQGRTIEVEDEGTIIKNG